MRLSIISAFLFGAPVGAFLSSTPRYSCGVSCTLPASDRDIPDFSVIEDDEVEPTSSYSPPDFTVENEDGESVAGKPPKVSSSRSDENDEDPYSEAESPVRQKGPRRPRRKPITKSDMEGTNWMQKNAKFSPEQDGMSMNESLPDGNNNKRSQLAETRSRLDPKTFRQDFRGTRVFVQGVPPGASWQDLKDHFQVAGNVVFASVSVDPRTGQPKGHGIVQFETTSMARNAIDIMRNYPLEGSTLYVREDVQESNNPNARLSGAPKGPTPPTKWKCANEDNAAHLSPEDLSSVRLLIKERDFARRNKKYDVSDRLRDELKHSYGIFIDDRLKMWWTAVDGNKVPSSIQDIKGDGRWKLDPWRQIPTTPENDACVDPDLVEGLLKQRDVARREKDFGTADALLEEARTSPDGDLFLRIHDESRTWRIWTESPPPRPVDNYSPRPVDNYSYPSNDPAEKRERAAKECFAIVEEFAPHKMDEIKMVLQKFEGREFQVLKRLKKQYL